MEKVKTLGFSASIMQKRLMALLIVFVLALTFIALPNFSTEAYGAPVLLGPGDVTVGGVPNGSTITGVFNVNTLPADIIIPREVIPGVPVTAIGNDAFAGANLGSVAFQAGSQVTSLGQRAFQSNPLAGGITLPATITSMGVAAFQGCTQLPFIDLSHLSGLTVIPDSAFNNCPLLVSPLLPPNLTTIGNDTFSSCPALTSIVIPSSVTSIGPIAFANNSIGVLIDASAHQPGAIPNAPWNNWNAHTVRWHPDGSDPSYYPFVFNPVTGRIAGLQESYAGDGNITIPLTVGGYPVTGLADGAFGSRPAAQVLSGITFTPGLPITTIPIYSFLGCTQLPSIAIPEGVTSIGMRAFQGSSNLTLLSLPDTLTTIADIAFFGTRLSTLNIPPQVTSIGSQAFGNIPTLTTVTFQGSAITTIGLGVFDGTTAVSLQDIHLTQKIQGSVAGSPWSAIRASVHWAAGVTDLPQVAVDDDGLWEFNTQTGTILTYLGSVVPAGTLNLEVPASLSASGISYPITTVGASSQRIVANGSHLASLTISSGITTIAGDAFHGVRVGSLDLGDTVTTIGTNTFLSSGINGPLTFPESIRVISSNAFSGSGITGTLVFPGNLTSVAVNAFNSNPGIIRIEVMQYRNQASDPGGYNPTGTPPTFLQSPTAVRNNLPWGAVNAARQVFFRDDPRPIATTTITLNPATNSATINLSAVMNNLSLISDIVPSAGMPALDGPPSIGIVGNVPSTASMTIPASATANGTYRFTIVFAGGASDLEIEVPLNVFHQVKYFGNGNHTGTVPVDNNWYVESYVFTLQGNTGTLHIPGETFGGWSTDPSGFGMHFNVPGTATMPVSQASTPGSPVAPYTDFNLYADWRGNEYRVAFFAGSNGTMMPAVYGEMIDHGDSVNTVPTITANPGWVFIGWLSSVSGGIYDASAILQLSIEQDTNFTAQYIRGDKATVIFDFAGGVNTSGLGFAVIQGYTGENIVAPSPDPTRTGYIFAGWSPDVTGATFGAPGTVTTYTAQWTARTFDVLFDAGAQGEFNSPSDPLIMQTVPFGANVTGIPALAITNAAYRFIGWSDGTSVYSAADVLTYPIAQNTVFTAQYALEDKATVVFDLAGGTFTAAGPGYSAGNRFVIYQDSPGATLTAPSSANFARPGFTFTGWQPVVSPTFGAAGTIVTHVAQWSAINYTATFVDWNATPLGSVTGIGYGRTVSQGTGGAIPANPSRAGFTFVGWTDSTGTIYPTAASVGTAIVTDNVTFTATYAPIINATAIFDFAGGNESGATTRVLSGLPGSLYVVPTPVRTGYTLNATTPWIIAPAGAIAGTHGAAGTVTTFTANWVANTYPVTFVAGTNGVFANPSDPNIAQTVTFGSSPATAPGITANASWTFAGWSDGSATYTSAQLASYVVRGATTFTAQYTRADMATVVFDFDGGVNVSGQGFVTIQGHTGDAVVAPVVNPTKTGFTFASWSPAVTGPNAIFGAPGTTRTYVAQWNAVSYPVMFNAGANGAFTNPSDPLITQSIAFNSSVSAIPAVTAQGGYTLVGWSDGTSTYTAAGVLSYPIKGATTFTAVYAGTDAGNAVVIFDFGGGVNGSGERFVMMQEPAGAALTAPASATLTRSGFTFAGWSPVVLPSFGAAGSVTTYTATWTALSYTATFNNFDASLIGTVTGIGYGQRVNQGTGSVPVNPSRSGFTFVGWSGPGGAIYPDAVSAGMVVITDNVIFTATYAPLIDAVAVFDFAGGSESGTSSRVISGLPGSLYTVPTPTRTGFTLNATTPWVITPVGATAGTHGTAGTITTFTANWVANTYNVTFAAGTDGVFTTPSDPNIAQTIAFNGSVAGVPVITPDAGWTFVGWQSSLGGLLNDAAIQAMRVTDNVTFTAQYVRTDKATVIFNFAGGVDGTGLGYAIVQDFPGATLTAPASATFSRPGYAFSGWNTTPSATFGAAGSITTYAATWTAIPRSVTFAAGANGSFATPSDPLATQSILNGSVVLGVPAIAADTGWVFVGWASSLGGIYNNVAVGLMPITADVTFTAQYARDDQAIVIFDYDGGKDGSERSFLVLSDYPGAALVAPTGLTKYGYAFDGWNVLIPSSFGTAGSTTTYTAQWRAVTHSVTFSAGTNGSFTTPSDPLASQSIEHLQSVTGVPAVSANTGWVFTGWSDGVSLYDVAGVLAYEIEANTTFTAIYIRSAMATVVFDFGGGRNASGDTFSIIQGYPGETYEYPTNLVRTGHIFDGWNTRARTTTGTFGDPASITELVAQWRAQTFTVTFVGHDGAVLGSITNIAYGNTVSTGTGSIPVPTRDGYTFAGWRTASGTYDATAVRSFAISEDTTFTATWTRNSNTNGSGGDGTGNGGTGNGGSGNTGGGDTTGGTGSGTGSGGSGTGASGSGSASNSPKTGDDSSAGLWTSLTALSVALASVALWVRKRRVVEDF